jgi:hypothetical protein
MSPTINLNDNYAVRFGMGAIKGGSRSSDHCSNRKDGKQVSFDLTKRIDFTRPKALKI